MARSKRPRKAYRPKACTPLDGYMKLTRAGVARLPMEEGDAGELELVVLSALEAISHGHGTPNEWNSVARAINHSWTLANQGIGSEVIGPLAEAEDAMRRAGDRFYKVGKVALDGDGLRAVREAIELWGQQLRICTVGEVDAATRLVEREYWRTPAEKGAAR